MLIRRSPSAHLFSALLALVGCQNIVQGETRSESTGGMGGVLGDVDPQREEPDEVASSGGTTGNGGTGGSPEAGGTGAKSSEGTGGQAPEFTFPERGTEICDDESLGLGPVKGWTGKVLHEDSAICIRLEQGGSVSWDWVFPDDGVPGDIFPGLYYGASAFSQSTSSTHLLPRRLEDLASLTLSLSAETTAIDETGAWSLLIIVWLTEENPTEVSTQPAAELRIVLGHSSNLEPSEPIDSSHLSDGHQLYQLYVSDDFWSGEGTYREYRLEVPANHFNSTVNLRSLLSDSATTLGWSDQLWVTQVAVVNQASADSAGSTAVARALFEVNGESQSATLN